MNIDEQFVKVKIVIEAFNRNFPLDSEVSNESETTVSLQIELPESIFSALLKACDQRGEKDHDAESRVIAIALADWLSEHDYYLEEEE